MLIAWKLSDESLEVSNDGEDGVRLLLAARIPWGGSILTNVFIETDPD